MTLNEKWKWNGKSLNGAPEWVLNHRRPEGYRTRIQVEYELCLPHNAVLVVPTTARGDQFAKPNDTLVHERAGDIRIVPGESVV